jgi:hypothetical protein
VNSIPAAKFAMPLTANWRLARNGEVDAIAFRN